MIGISAFSCTCLYYISTWTRWTVCSALLASSGVFLTHACWGFKVVNTKKNTFSHFFLRDFCRNQCVFGNDGGAVIQPVACWRKCGSSVSYDWAKYMTKQKIQAASPLSTLRVIGCLFHRPTCPILAAFMSKTCFHTQLHDLKTHVWNTSSHIVSAWTHGDVCVENMFRLSLWEVSTTLCSAP